MNQSNRHANDLKTESTLEKYFCKKIVQICPFQDVCLSDKAWSDMEWTGTYYIRQVAHQNVLLNKN